MATPAVFAISAVVPLPRKGSSTISLARAPANIHGIIKAGGNVAKWVPG